MIVREERVSEDVLRAIYQTLKEIIKDPECFYTKTELEELRKSKEYKKLGGTKENG